MSDQIQKTTLRDSAGVRWTALLLLALAMFCAYIFVDILSPIKDLMESQRGWSSKAFGTMQGSETFLNVFVFFLIFAGIILDKMGVRFTALLSGLVMLCGACIKYYAISESFKGTGLDIWFTNNLNHIPIFEQLGVSPFYDGMPSSAKVASIGFMLFGCGTEMAGITVSRGIVKWFKGREMALAMGSEMALARLGVATCMIFSPFFAKFGGSIDVSRSVAFGVVLICIAVMMFVVYFFMDKKLDSQTGEAEEQDDPFKLSDLGKILSSMGFWLVSLLCVLYYSAIFPFQKYAVNMLQCNLTFEPVPSTSFWASSTVTFVQYGLMLVIAATAFMFNFMKNKGVKYGVLCISICSLLAYCYMGYMRQSAETIFAVFPLLAVGITPILGSYVDHKGKAASMLVLGSILLIACHLTFAFVLPMLKGNDVGGVMVAYLTILVLGASFSLVPASLWPSVPKLVDAKIIGSAYALIFWIQNIGLWLFPLLIGNVLDATNRGITDPTKLNYTAPLLMLAGLGVAALVIGLFLKVVDKKKHLGLEEPNIKE
ncbi:MAG: MFS transporter [Prevotella bivia]|uniref:Lysosomal dipeptide transporter MFSD1 n=1 Tax=Prevotella bivia DSM 20514 TaxID=868129 RepID=I4ZC04_9BACT|nr:MFS transporter [Prevotella bivia]EFB93661.1 transporter, major facilitator family protein [Prevotella bivia JCVIHMP010]EIM33746.1 nitrate/nitrite transporter [Prevotella bivia DSM 20514]MDU6554654.1 MFS transporter [Prevotella bivia]